MYPTLFEEAAVFVGVNNYIKTGCMKKMKQVILLLLIVAIIVLISCNKDECTDTNVYTYNAENGQCENCEGTVGFNIFDIQSIRTTRNAECLDLSGQKLVFLLDTSMIENFQEFGDNKLEEYNFKGSRFDSCELFFNNILESDFAGADLSKLEFGYAIIEGYVDEYTIIPDGCPAVENDSLYCIR